MRLGKRKSKLVLNENLGNTLDNIKDNDVFLDVLKPKISEKNQFFDIVNDAIVQENNIKKNTSNGGKVKQGFRGVGLFFIVLLVLFFFLCFCYFLYVMLFL